MAAQDAAPGTGIPGQRRYDKRNEPSLHRPRQRRDAGLKCAGRIELRVRLNARGKSPRELREAFATVTREAIARAFAAGRIDRAIAEELYRTVPREGRA